MHATLIHVGFPVHTTEHECECFSGMYICACPYVHDMQESMYILGQPCLSAALLGVALVCYTPVCLAGSPVHMCTHTLDWG